MITISHTIISTDSKGYAKQEMNLTHQEYLELIEHLTTETIIQEEKEDYEFLKNMLFGGKYENRTRD